MMTCVRRVCLAAETRGADEPKGLWRPFAALVGMIEAVLDDYVGMQYDERLVCPSCVKAGRWGGGDATTWELHEDIDENDCRAHCMLCQAGGAYPCDEMKWELAPAVALPAFLLDRAADGTAIVEDA